MKPRNILYSLFAAAFLYVAVAFAVFEWRHPWATGNERLVWSWSALKFENVPYEIMRRREKQ